MDIDVRSKPERTYQNWLKESILSSYVTWIRRIGMIGMCAEGRIHTVKTHFRYSDPYFTFG